MHLKEKRICSPSRDCCVSSECQGDRTLRLQPPPLKPLCRGAWASPRQVVACGWARERDFPAPRPRPGRPCRPTRQEPVGTSCSRGCPACKPQYAVGGLQPPQASQTSSQRKSHCRFLPSPARPGASPGDRGEPEGAAGVPRHGLESWWGREGPAGGPWTGGHGA